MQSKTTRGVRHLLVSTGVISLVLSVAAPAALAEKPDDRKVWVCHPTSSLTNPWEFNHVSVDAGGGNVGIVADQELFAGFKNKAELRKALAEGGVLEAELVESCNEQAAGSADGDEGEDHGAGGEEEDDDNGVGGGDGQGGGQEGDNGVRGGQGGDDGVTIVDETPVEVGPGTGTSNGNGPGMPAAPATPATPVQPLPVVQPRPVIVISDDAVSRPVTPAIPATPVAAPAVAPAAENEVLGAITTRVPTAVGATVQTTGSVSVLAATGAGTTWILATLGLTLLLAGLGLQVGARRRVRAVDVRT